MGEVQGLVGAGSQIVIKCRADGGILPFKDILNPFLVTKAGEEVGELADLTDADSSGVCYVHSTAITNKLEGGWIFITCEVHVFVSRLSVKGIVVQVKFREGLGAVF